MQYDYISVGQVVIDAFDGGERQPGGSALYGALQASRLGLRALLRTRGEPKAIEALLEPWASEFELEVQPARQTTTLGTRGSGTDREQRVLAWAGPFEPLTDEPCAVLHLAPVAAELPSQWPAGGRLLGLTPQGLIRSWEGDGPIVHGPVPRAALAQATELDALVVSEHERAACAALAERALDGGAIVAVTAGPEPVRLMRTGGETVELEVREAGRPVDDLGAGDVFAAALFVGLAEGRNAEQAVLLASAAAALRIEGPGPGAIAQRARIEARLLAA